MNLKGKWETGSQNITVANVVEFIYTMSGVLVDQFYAWYVDNIHIVCKLCLRMLNQYVAHTKYL